MRGSPCHSGIPSSTAESTQPELTPARPRVIEGRSPDHDTPLSHDAPWEQPFAEAHAALEASEPHRALAALDQAIAASANAPGPEASARILAAQLLAALDRHADAHPHAQRALQIAEDLGLLTRPPRAARHLATPHAKLTAASARTTFGAWARWTTSPSKG